MTKLGFKNKTIERNLEEILNSNTIATRGGVSGNSIEVMEGNSMASYTYYDDEKSCLEDLEKLNKLLKEKTGDYV
jgi:hypothetical protein